MVFMDSAIVAQVPESDNLQSDKGASLEPLFEAQGCRFPKNPTLGHLSVSVTHILRLCLSPIFCENLSFVIVIFWENGAQTLLKCIFVIPIFNFSHLIVFHELFLSYYLYV